MLAFMLIGFAWLIGAATDGLSNLAMWSLIVGALTPPLVAVVQRPTFNKHFRVIVMVAAAAVDGVVVSWLQGDLDFSRFTNSALIAGVAIISAYQGIWKPTGIAPRIERATS
jgi:hypothetical protein